MFLSFPFQALRIRIPRLEAKLNSTQREVLHEEEGIPLTKSSLTAFSPAKSSLTSKDENLPDSDDSGATTISYTSTAETNRFFTCNISNSTFLELMWVLVENGKQSDYYCSQRSSEISSVN